MYGLGGGDVVVVDDDVMVHDNAHNVLVSHNRCSIAAAA